MHTTSKTLSTFTTLLVLSCLATNLSAAEGQFYIAPGIQWMNFDDHISLDEDEGYFLGLGYDFTDRWSAEFNIAEVDASQNSGSDVDVDIWKVDLLYGLDLNIGPLDTFVVTGFGNTDFDSDSDTLWNYGGGVKYDFSDNITLRTAIRNFHYLGRDLEDNDFGVEAALIFRFGGASRPAPAPAVSEAPRASVPAPEPDSDGDGVPDSRDACPDTPRNYAVDARGCPIPIEEVARVELEVYFEFDRSEVRPQYFDEVQEIADFMNQYQDVVVELEGHTDSTGTEQYNQGLSQRRADAVRQVLIDRFNIQGSRISATGYGESQPIATNDTAAGRQQNRRVITVIVRTLQNYQPR
jgi:OOP family OmpA-OmpF porin